MWSLNTDQLRNSTRVVKNKLPAITQLGLIIQFKRWKERSKEKKLLNHFTLINIGGISFGTGLDIGKPGKTDDINPLVCLTCLRPRENMGIAFLPTT